MDGAMTLREPCPDEVPCRSLSGPVLGLTPRLILPRRGWAALHSAQRVSVTLMSSLSLFGFSSEAPEFTSDFISY